MPIIGFEDVPGKMFEAMEEAGHGRGLVIVDYSYDIDRTAHDVVDYRGQSSAQALGSVLRLVRREGPITIMAPDPGDDSALGCMAEVAFMGVATQLNIAHEVVSVPRLGEAAGGVGFYDLVDDERRKVIVRTPDPLPYACAMFVIGHYQFGPQTAA